MCNLYNLTTSQDAMRRLFRLRRDRYGNLQPSLDVYPDLVAPVIRLDAAGERELAPLFWGMPSPASIRNNRPDAGITNIRNTASPHWRPFLAPHHRCIVPFSRFCEWEDTRPKKTQRWFSPANGSMAAFAGIWTEWQGMRGSLQNPRPGSHELFGILSCKPNAVVAPIHPEAMPVILTGEAEIAIWLHAPWSEARQLQRPLAENELALLPLPRPEIEPELPLFADVFRKNS